MATRTCLVTGSAGFVGSVLARTLVSRGWRVVGVDREAVPSWRECPDVSQVQLDLCDLEAVVALVGETRPEVIFHLAAQPFVPVSVAEPYATVRDNVLATTSVLEAARLHGVARVVHASSGAIYGSEPGEHTYFENDEPKVGANLYGPSKIAAENIVLAYSRTFALDVRIGRFMNTYGPGDTSPSRIVPTAVCQALGGDCYDFGDRDDGSTALDFVYVDDVVAGYLAAAEVDDGALQGVYNFGTCDPVSVRDLVCAISRLADGAEREPVFRGPVADNPRRKCLDAGRARKELDWEPRTDLMTGLRETVDWYREHLHA
ncbi:NAD-dependent epimerase/dehydratase family protein [Nonomuraea sp. NPDC050663]|uniref:NAD-dependent epimerase/dehydratase family protein n=1 Tax=Nonomuraea sp. NPDC050663 TaxID=3364370 RepID=UPI0037A04EA2